MHAVVNAMPASDRHALVMKSTVPVGTGAAIKRVFEEQGKSGFRYVSCPEFLKEGSAVDDFLDPDRVVVGDDGDWAGDAVVDLYRPLLTPEHGGGKRGELVRTDIASAEMVKLASNAFLATKISFINEIANVCEETGADVIEVAKGMGLDARIGPKFLQAGIGFGGSCFPKDVSALKQLAGNSGYHFQLLNAVIEVNELQKRRVIGKLQKHLGPLVGKRIALLGLAFKPETDDMREASSLVLSARLIADGADVVGSTRSPLKRPASCSRAWSSRERLGGGRGADAVVLVTGVAGVQGARPPVDRVQHARQRVHRWPQLLMAMPPASRASCTRASVVATRRRSTSCLRPAPASDPAPNVIRQAVILVGGQGTRLGHSPLGFQARPRRRRSPVPRAHARLALEPRHHEAVLCCGFKADSVVEHLGEGEAHGIKLTYVHEPERAAPPARSSSPRSTSRSAS